VYSSHSTFVLGFHGCDRSVANDVISGKKSLQKSSNEYDWLGSGIYFWENSPKRALHYAEQIKRNPGRCTEIIADPTVIGAVIDLGRCLDLLDSECLQLVKDGYELLKQAVLKSGFPLPTNKPIEEGGDLLLRNLDRAVLEMLHKYFEEKDSECAFDTSRAMFVEGEKLYPNAGFNEKNHIQICVRNPNCIKGYFHVRAPNTDFKIP
jgi:hypothetical protein